MILAVISDTHLSHPAPWLERVYEKHLASADVVIHCGDVTGYPVWSYLMQHPRFYCVQGNCDWEPQLASELEPRLSIELEGFSVGACHGWGSRSGVPARVAEAFGTEYDLVCYGHTHARDWSVVQGVQLLNPGSLGEFRSLALVTLERGRPLDCRFVDA